MRPTIVIGLGGLGKHVLGILRDQLEAAGTLLDGPVTFLHLDTHRPQDDASSDELGLTIDNTHACGVSHKRIARWWHKGLNRLNSVVAGTEGCRPYGRLALFHNFEGVRDGLRTAHARVRDPLVECPPEWSVDLRQPTDVYIVAAMGGGTGSGALLDLSFLLKQQFREHGAHLHGFLIFPESPHDDLGWANSYALLKEVNHYSYGLHQYEVEWREGQPQRVSIPPFDQCYLFHAPPESHLNVDEVVAGAIFTDLAEGDFSEHKRSLRVNLKQYASRTFDVEHGNFSQQFVCRYSSLGQAVFQVPFQQLQRACSLRLARELLSSWLHLKPTQEPSVASLVNSLGIEPEQIRNSEGMIQALVFGDEPQEVLLKLQTWAQHWTHELTTAPVASAEFNPLANLERSTRDLETRLISVGLLNSRASAVLSRTIRRVEQYLSQQMQEMGVLAPQVGHSLQALVEAFRAAAAALPKQTAWWAEHCRLQVNEAGRMLAELRRLSTRHNWDGRKATIRKRLLARYFQFTVDFTPEPGSLACWAWERAGYEALEVCRKVLQHLNEVLKPRLEAIQLSFQEMDGELARGYQEEVSRLAASPGGLDWVAQLEKIYAHFVNESTVTHTRQAVVARRGLLENSADGLLDVLLEETAAVFGRIKIQFSPAQLLCGEMSAQQRTAVLRTLVEESRAWIRGQHKNHVFQLQSHQVHSLIGLPSLPYLCSVEERERFNSAMHELKTHIAAEVSGPISFAYLSNCDRVVFYQEAAGFPLNFLDGLQTARDHYLRHLLAGEPLHVNEGVDPAVDFQVHSAAELQAMRAAMRCFVLGSFFNLIESQQGRYHWADTEGTTPLLQRDQVVLYLSHAEIVRQRLSREASEQWESLKKGADLEQIARLGALVALQKKSAYGNLWGRVSGPHELPPYDRLEVSVLSELEEELHDCPTVHRQGTAALHRITEGLLDSIVSIDRGREDGRYSWSQPVVQPLPRKRKKQAVN